VAKSQKPKDTVIFEGYYLPSYESPSRIVSSISSLITCRGTWRRKSAGRADRHVGYSWYNIDKGMKSEAAYPAGVRRSYALKVPRRNLRDELDILDQREKVPSVYH
jgi:hypothetical protein